MLEIIGFGSWLWLGYVVCFSLGRSGCGWVCGYVTVVAICFDLGLGHGGCGYGSCYDGKFARFCSNMAVLLVVVGFLSFVVLANEFVGCCERESVK